MFVKVWGWVRGCVRNVFVILRLEVFLFFLDNKEGEYFFFIIGFFGFLRVKNKVYRVS